MNVTYNSRSELNTSAYHVGKRRNSLHMTVRVLIESHTRWFYPGASTSNDSGRVSSEIGSILRCENMIPGTRFPLVIRHQAHDMHMACPANLNDDLSMFASEIHQLWRTVAKLNVKVYENNDVNVNILNILNDINDNSRSRRVLHICNAINGGDGHPYWKFGAKSFLFNATMIRIFRNSRTGHFFQLLRRKLTIEDSSIESIPNISMWNSTIVGPEMKADVIYDYAWHSYSRRMECDRMWVYWCEQWPWVQSYLLSRLSSLRAEREDKICHSFSHHQAKCPPDRGDYCRKC